jgi:hypothetical protein
VATPVSPSGGNYVGKVTFDASCYGPSYAFDPATPDHISWYFRADGDTGHASGLGFTIMSNTGGQWMAHVSYHLGALRIYQSGSGDVQITTASTGTWYLIELKNIDWDSDTFDIWVDGVEKVVGASFYTHVDDVSYFMNYACPSASGPAYVDDITFGFAPVGGIAELPDVGQGDSSARNFIALAGAAAALLALTAGAWYARRRWGR